MQVDTPAPKAFTEDSLAGPDAVLCPLRREVYGESKARQGKHGEIVSQRKDCLAVVLGTERERLDFFFFFLTRVFMRSPGCPGTSSVDQASLKLRQRSTASALRVAELKVCATVPSSVR